MSADYSHIYNSINDEILELVKNLTKDGRFTFDATSDQEIPHKQKRLLEIGWYVCAGLYLAYKQGLYLERTKIEDYIIAQKLKEFNDVRLNTLVDDYNIKFQISSFMVIGIQQARSELA